MLRIDDGERPTAIQLFGSVPAELAEAGHAVCINYLTHRQEAETLAEKIRNHGGNAIAVQADVADRAAVEAMVRTAEAELGP